MKTRTLLLTALLSLASVAGMAQTKTIDIPTTGDWQLDPTDAEITIVNSYIDPTNPDTYEKDRTSDTDDAGHKQFNNMRSGDYATFSLNNTKEAAYIIRLNTACKKNGVKLQLTLTNENGDVDYDETLKVTRTRNWTTWVDVNMYITDPIEVGKKTLKITFLSDDNKETVNLRNIRFEAVDGGIKTYSLYTYTTVNGEDNPDAGTITVSPLQNNYMQDTEITCTATANTGYKFVGWDVDGETLEYNPYTFNINETTDLTAMFEEVKMYNDIPGAINPDSRYLASYGEVDDAGVMGNYRKGQMEEFKVEVAKDDTYNLTFQASSKMDEGVVTFSIVDEAAYEADSETTPEWTQTFNVNTGNWKKFTEVTASDIKLKAGKKLLILKFDNTNDNKYTVNLKDITFTSADPTGIETIKAAEAATKGKRYSISGAQVSKTFKGIVIVNGKKFVNK